MNAEPNGKFNDPSVVLQLLNAVPMGVVVCNSDGIIRYINKEMALMFGYEEDELINTSVDNLLPVSLSHTHSKLRESYWTNPSTRHMGVGRELFGRRKNNSEFPIEVGLSPLAFDEEKLVIATIVDISQRKQLEQKFSKVIDASPFGIMLVDPKGTIQLLNNNLLKLFGYNKEELIHQSMDILLPERYQHMHEKLRNSYIAAPSLRAMGAGRDLTGQHKNGTEIPIEIGLNTVNVEDETLVLAVISDITERKRLELSLRQANAHMEEFTYVASHDLKSPLRGIADLIEWIEEDLGDISNENVKNNIGRIKVRISRMENLVSDLLIYARAGQRSKEQQLVNFQDLIRGIIEMHPIPDIFKIKTDIQLKEITTAKTPLETVIRNLFSNALKHHDGQSPEVIISVQSEGSFCVIRVKDNGPGIPESAQERVFRLFQTLTNNVRSGGGIGLSLAKRLVESHGGRIELNAKDGQRGTEFIVYWPRYPRKDIVE
jgi:PAS domain S-box-containing protein